MTQRYRNIVFTHFNNTINDWKNCSILEYCIIGSEICPSTGKHHLQGYGELKNQTRLTSLKKSLPQGCHFERRFGSQKEAIDYCKKDNKWEEWGERKKQGNRIDRHKLKELARAGERISTVVSEYDVSFNEIKFYEKLQTIFEVPQRRDVEVIWICGDPGVGKSRLAEKLAGSDVYDKRGDSKWWDGYDGQETIILDEWRPSKYWNVSNTLGVLGGERMRVEVKGGSKVAKWKRIFVTTVDRPEEYWRKNHSDEQIKQLTRRITRLAILSQSQRGGNTNPSLRWEEY
jgi:hypothetical protein